MPIWGWLIYWLKLHTSMEICFERETWKKWCQGNDSLSSNPCFTRQNQAKTKKSKFHPHHMEKGKRIQAIIYSISFLNNHPKSLQNWLMMLICPPTPKTWKSPKLENRSQGRKDLEHFRAAPNKPIYKHMKIQNHPWCWALLSLAKFRHAVNGTAPSQPPYER